MRVLWIVIVMVVIAGAAATWNRLAAPVDPDAAALREAIEAADAPPTGRPRAESSGGSGAPGATAAATTQASGDTSRPPSGDGGGGASAVPTVDGSNSAQSSPAPSGSLADELANAAIARGAGSKAAVAAGKPGTESGDGAKLDAGGDESEKGTRIEDTIGTTLGSAEVVAGDIRRKADGTLRADDRFTIRGSGTVEDPFRVSWELLLSASETYQPRLNQNQIPQRVALLSGKRVRIEGYVAFPAFAFDPKEMLMMLNQWDGCCIGVPPTPFDAIEVRLAEAPANRRRHGMAFGFVEGTLTVEPYLVDSWLVGLYVMDDAVLKIEM